MFTTARRSTSMEKAHVSLSLRVKSTGEFVHFKHDGSRFDQPQTLKLCEGESYVVQLSATGDEGIQLIAADIGGRNIELTHEKDRRNSATGEWIADCVRPTKRGTRDELLFTVQIKYDGARRSAVFPLQVKTYAAPTKKGASNHAVTSGEPLAHLQFDMAWDSSSPYSPIAKTDCLRFSRRSSSARLKTTEPAVPDVASAA